MGSLSALQLVPESRGELESGERAQHIRLVTVDQLAQSTSVTTTDRAFGIDQCADKQRGIDDDMQRVDLSDRIVLGRLALPRPAHDARQP